MTRDGEERKKMEGSGWVRKSGIGGVGRYSIYVFPLALTTLAH